MSLFNCIFIGDLEKDSDQNTLSMEKLEKQNYTQAWLKIDRFLDRVTRSVYPCHGDTLLCRPIKCQKYHWNHEKVHWNHIKYNSVQEAMDAPDGLAVLGIIMVENTRRANFR